ncbi:uncharacterized protein F5Z01DRAFT_295002 [Emericellopsis atlantica]|uniref:Uncharacterized protein n=1 Tax=Emericellopsis atlantica TaxID=2614577 RepID=A0A9P7ZGB9_9HYPO|nr:uncharacterized protein F5Z01DRAFT_295002 [Emericellopsis atlantica]KAG9251147.1 hypothetical protein F5Z01DRAFT_295002 [Emericellopsis atlantica]
MTEKAIRPCDGPRRAVGWSDDLDRTTHVGRAVHVSKQNLARERCSFGKNGFQIRLIGEPAATVCAALALAVASGVTSRGPCGRRVGGWAPVCLPGFGNASRSLDKDSQLGMPGRRRAAEMKMQPCSGVTNSVSLLFIKEAHTSRYISLDGSGGADVKERRGPHRGRYVRTHAARSIIGSLFMNKIRHREVCCKLVSATGTLHAPHISRGGEALLMPNE